MMSKLNMFHTNSFPIQRGRGDFIVDRYSLQRGRGLGGIFASLLRKIAPFGKTFLRTSKNILESETGKSILNDTINSAAAAATSAILENDQDGAKRQMMNSLKRSGNKTKNAVGKIAKNKLEKVLTGKGKLQPRKNRKKRKSGKNKLSLLED